MKRAKNSYSNKLDKNSKKYFYKILAIVILLAFIYYIKIIEKLRIDTTFNESYKKFQTEEINEEIKFKKNNNINVSFKKCFQLQEYSKIRVIHFIITRFLIDIFSKGFPKKDYNSDYIQNGIRVMEKYLLTSLENQSCKDFIWILMIGNKANITYINSLFNSNNSFEKKILLQRELKNFLRNKTKGYDVLITTRIDYDDEIYYDAVNDVRKLININKPILVHGYNNGVNIMISITSMSKEFGAYLLV